MASSTEDVGSGRNTRTNMTECGNSNKVMSVPIYREVCCASGILKAEKPKTDHNKAYCTCNMEGLVSSTKQHNSAGVQGCAQQRRTHYRRSLSLPASRKGLYDIVVSEDLLCPGHICNHASEQDKQTHPVGQSFKDRDLVKMEIEMELANSVPEELKAVEYSTNEQAGTSSQGVRGNLHVVDADVETTASIEDGEASQWSLDIPDLLRDKIQSRKQIQRSYSWSFAKNFTDIGPNSLMNHDNFVEFANSELQSKSKTVPREKRSKDVAGRTRHRCGTKYRNVRATLSLNEQELQALEEHLEQNVYVPVQLLIGSRGSRQRPGSDLQRPLFALAEIVTNECSVCYAMTLVRQRECCNGYVCDSCFQEYLSMKINQRIVTIQCVMYKCKKYLTREEISYHVDHATREKFYRFILEANCDANHQKTCPQCNFLKTVDKNLVSKKTWFPFEAKVCCEQCDFEWCFPCHSPWHDGMSCKEFWKGDRLLKDWAKERPHGIVNAHKCPKCRVFIQRSSGCDSMTCSRCGTGFCYQCGGRFRGIRYFGNHYSRYSIFGCKYRYKPEDPVERRAVRGAIFGLQVLALPFVPCVAVLAGCVLLVAVAPAFGIKALRQYHSRRKYRKERDRIALENWELGDPLVMKRYTSRRAYQMGDKQIEVAYP